MNIFLTADVSVYETIQFRVITELNQESSPLFLVDTIPNKINSSNLGVLRQILKPFLTLSARITFLMALFYADIISGNQNSIYLIADLQVL